MKFVRFECRDGVFPGIVREEAVVVISGSPFTAYQETKTSYLMSEVKLLPPVIPTKIIGIGRNYRQHIEEVGVSIPERPRYFFKPPSSLIGHEDDIVIPRNARQVDYEDELAIVIKDKIKDVPEDKALDHVLGCSCFNDVTEKALVRENIVNLVIAKGFDTFSAFGPFITTGLDPNDLGVKTYLNGKQVQNDTTKSCVFNVQQILHYLSQCMTLYPGDIVATGTPKGVASLSPGDIIEVEVQGVGRLRNRVRTQ